MLVSILALTLFTLTGVSYWQYRRRQLRRRQLRRRREALAGRYGAAARREAQAAVRKSSAYWMTQIGLEGRA